MDGTRSAASPADTPRRHPLALFARNFLRQPLAVGTFTPSSRWVVRRLLAAIDFERAQHLVEYGPGIGTITAGLLERMAPNARLVVIETNGEFAEYLGERFRDPRLTVVHGSAEQVRAATQAAGMRTIDQVVTGIPLSTLPRAVTRRVLDETRALLASDGRLLVYQYSTSALPELRARFAEVGHAVEWRNLLPMHLYDCRGRRIDGG